MKALVIVVQKAVEVVGLAAGDQVAVDDDLLVHPVRAGVAQVGLQARPGRHACGRFTTSASISVHGAWQIAATGLPASKNAFTNATASGVGAQEVGVGDPAGQHERVVVRRRGRATCVHVVGVALVQVVERLDRPGFQRDQLGRRRPPSPPPSMARSARPARRPRRPGTRPLALQCRCHLGTSPFRGYLNPLPALERPKQVGQVRTGEDRSGAAEDRLTSGGTGRRAGLSARPAGDPGRHGRSSSGAAPVRHRRGELAWTPSPDRR